MELFLHNIPFFSIMLAMFAGIATVPIRKGRAAFYVSISMLGVELAMSAALVAYLLQTGETITFAMGHFPAPWGNEIRAGIIEAMLALLFSAVMLFSVLSGEKDIFTDILPKKQNIYFIMYNELFGSMLALIYTNDIFTGYVFIEISMISASSIIMAKDSGRSLIATLRYLIMMLLGSGLFLLGVIMLYCITGHLLMPDLGEAVTSLVTKHSYPVALLCTIGLICIGLAIKSAVFPFHTMLPGAHSVATTTSSAVLSGLVLKAYIILLIKVITRVISIDTFADSGMQNVVLVLGLIGTLICSGFALKETDIKRMIAYSSSAQIGYIYIGIGLASTGGLVAALLHIFVHALTKSMMFVCAGNMAGECGHNTDMRILRGAAYRNKPAALGFTVAALSMIGIPLFPGFATKLYLGIASYENPWMFGIVLATLLVSMLLNAMYFIPAVIAIWSHPNDEDEVFGHKPSKLFTACIVVMTVLVFALGVGFKPVAEILGEAISTL